MIVARRRHPPKLNQHCWPRSYLFVLVCLTAIGSRAKEGWSIAASRREYLCARPRRAATGPGRNSAEHRPRERKGPREEEQRPRSACQTTATATLRLRRYRAFFRECHSSSSRLRLTLLNRCLAVKQQ